MTVRNETEEELEARLTAERLGIPFLVYRDGEDNQKIFPLEPARRSVTIGRRDEADISMPWDPECSRLHAELELRAGEWTITDDGLSQNGTWVNELRLVGRRRLADGDIVRIGRSHITYSRPGVIGIGPTLVPGELSATPRFSEQQQRILRALCRPLFVDGVGINPASDEKIAAATGISLEAVQAELDHLGRALGLDEMPVADQRAEIALLAMRSGLVSADEGG
jgi:FHA domain